MERASPAAPPTDAPVLITATTTASADGVAYKQQIADQTAGTVETLLANPPFGVEWKKVQEEVVAEHRTLGLRGRFGAGLPRINDGSLLFLQHMISKMTPVAPDGTQRRDVRDLPLGHDP